MYIYIYILSIFFNIAELTFSFKFCTMSSKTQSILLWCQRKLDFIDHSMR